MKKLVAISALVLLLLSACVARPIDPSNPIEPNEDTMVINIKNHANFDFYVLQVRILDHSPTVVNADGSIMEQGELLSFEFLEEDFTLSGKAEMAIAIETGQGHPAPINEKMTIELANNQGIFYELTGDSIEEASIKRID